MDSETLLKLPIIDFSDLDSEANSPRWEAVKSEVYKSLVEYGCFEALFNKVPLELRKAIFAAHEELFNLPLPIKLKLCYVSDQKPYLGYDGYHPELPLYEALGIEDANVAEQVESITKILWPEGNPTFSKTIQSLSEKLAQLDHMIRKMILEVLGVEKYLEEHTKLSNFLLRVQKYKSPQTNEKEVGLNSHTDKNLVTILYQNEVDGLEVQTKDGRRWIKYKHSPDKFIVMIGDSFHAWTNGRLHSPHHRVMMTGNEARYSLALFSNPKVGYMFRTPEELVDEEHPLLFQPFDLGEFMKFYYTEQGHSAESALRTYCGA